MITTMDVLQDLRERGHYHAVTHVLNSLKRLEAREANVSRGANMVRHSTSSKAADDAAGQVVEEARRAAV